MANAGKKFALGATLGLVAGAVAGLLFAPKSGKETRKFIKEKVVDLTQKGKKLAETGKEKIQDSIDKIKDQIKS